MKKVLNIKPVRKIVNRRNMLLNAALISVYEKQLKDIERIEDSVTEIRNYLNKGKRKKKY